MMGEASLHEGHLYAPEIRHPDERVSVSTAILNRKRTLLL